MATHWTLGCDAADPQRLAAFWAQALRLRARTGLRRARQRLDRRPRGSRPGDRLPAGARGQDRQEPRCTSTSGWPASRRGTWSSGTGSSERVAELVAAGATRVREEHYDGELGHVVMLDPEGNEFCVA